VDVAVDLRRGAPTFGRAQAVVLDDRDAAQLWIPVGFAHGFHVLSEVADVLYEVTAEYAPDAERGLAWDDPDLAIDWGDGAPALSDRDRRWPRLRDVPASDLFAWEEEA
jgi:dTDP-4-dehydrorhamnose 3,5-epimerase